MVKIDVYNYVYYTPKAIVENHQRQIAVDSLLGEGTTFTINLPQI